MESDTDNTALSMEQQLSVALLAGMASFKVLISTAEGLRQEMLTLGWDDTHAQAVAAAWLTKYLIQ